MRDEREQDPREAGSDSQQPRTTGDEPDRSERIGPPGTTQVGESLKGAPTEDSPAREPTERVERLEERSPAEEHREGAGE